MAGQWPQTRACRSVACRRPQFSLPAQVGCVVRVRRKTRLACCSFTHDCRPSCSPSCSSCCPPPSLSPSPSPLCAPHLQDLLRQVHGRGVQLLVVHPHAAAARQHLDEARVLKLKRPHVRLGIPVRTHSPTSTPLTDALHAFMHQWASRGPLWGRLAACDTAPVPCANAPIAPIWQTSAPPTWCPASVHALVTENHSSVMCRTAALDTAMLSPLGRGGV